MRKHQLSKAITYNIVHSKRRGASGKNSNGGVAILYRENYEVDWHHEGIDFIAQAVWIGKRRWVFISFYVKHGTDRENKTFLKTLASKIKQTCTPTDCLVLGGDANAHILSLAAKSNRRGQLLEEFAVENGLTILNMTDRCEGRYTREKSAIDYFLMNSIALSHVEKTTVDEDRLIAMSDHNLISLRCRAARRTPQLTKRRVTKVQPQLAAQNAEKQLADRLDTMPRTCG
ncbi:uncharacterized protein LOC108863993 [Galendromus occidentalis]|uniref:Uncharacterized protein LOC108863993 n=1 Tax=Galendromus occidentalis TaxID=34638 RepID=A0AAJ7P9D8_9ACAR|nr:uncharacterized protein LOC108863993 [Galendromus occidentalis]